MVEAILGGGRRSRFDQVRRRRAAGVSEAATALRGPLHVLGMLWYALRDRIG